MRNYTFAMKNNNIFVMKSTKYTKYISIAFVTTALLIAAFSLQITAHSALANSNQVKINNHGSFSCGNGGDSNGGSGGDATGGAGGGNGGIGGSGGAGGVAGNGGVCTIG
jgi:hypothetical protein